MSTPYSVSDILKCIEIINHPGKKYYKDDDKIFNLNNTENMKKKITQSQGTFGETIETEEMIEETFDSAEPFEITEITKIDNSDNEKNNVPKDVLILTNEIKDELSLKEINKKNPDIGKIKKLNKQISNLEERNTILENDLNQISKVAAQKVGDKDLQIKFELVYEQQRVIQDYEKQISKLRDENQKLEQKFELPPGWLTGDLQYSPSIKDNPEEGTKLLNQEQYNEELKTKSKIIYEQQNILKDYQDQITKLKEENYLLGQNLEVINNSNQASEENVQEKDEKSEEMVKKIKFYQDDNLRLSNEVVQLSTKLENTKQQLRNFENNKAKLMAQLKNLNNIVSQNNVIDSPFDTVASKIENKSVPTETIPDNIKTTSGLLQNTYTPKNIKNFEEMNRLTKEIFKKEK